MKKFLSISLALAVAAAAIFIGRGGVKDFVAGAESENLITNGSLESGTDGWTINDGTNRVTWYNDGKGANGTNAYVGINKGWGGPGVFAWKVDPFVNDGCWYRLSFWVKNPSGKRMAIKVYDGGDEANKRLFEELPQSDDWVKVSYLLQTEQYKAMAWLGFTYIDDKGTGGMDTSQILYVDEFTLTKVADSERMLANGDFESLPEKVMWHGASTATLKNDNGNHYAEIAGTQRLIQDLGGYEASGDFYKLSMKLSGNNPLNIKFTDGGETTWWEGTVTPKGSFWNDYELIFNNSWQTVMQLTFTGTDAGASVYIDDIKLEKVSPDTTGIVTNGNFEYGAYGWSGSTGTAKFNNGFTKDGSLGCLQLPGGSYQRFYQNLNTSALKQNTTYKVSFDLLVDETGISGNNINTGVQLKVLYRDAAQWDADALSEKICWAKNQWTNYSLTFNSGERTAVVLGFQANIDDPANGYTATAYIDNVRVTEVGADLTSSNTVGLYTGADASKNSGITGGSADSAVYTGKNGTDGDGQHTAMRFYGSYKCPKGADGNPDAAKIIVNGEACSIVSRTITWLRPTVKDGAYTDNYSISNDYKAEGDALKYYWDAEDNGDGTYTVRYSLLIKNISKKNKDKPYAFSTEIVYADNTETHEWHTQNGAKLGCNDGHTLTAQAAYDAAAASGNTLSWFD